MVAVLVDCSSVMTHVALVDKAISRSLLWDSLKSSNLPRAAVTPMS